MSLNIFVYDYSTRRTDSFRDRQRSKVEGRVTEIDNNSLKIQVMTIYTVELERELNGLPWRGFTLFEGRLRLAGDVTVTLMTFDKSNTRRTPVES